MLPTYRVWSALKGLLFWCLGAERFATVQGWYWANKLRKKSYDADVFDTLKRVLSPGASCLDIGANVGQYSVNLSQIVGPRGHVWAFEPVGYTRSILTVVLLRFGIQNVTVMSEALSDQSLSTTMVTPLDGFGVPQLGLSYLGTLDAQGKGLVGPIRMCPLDSLPALADRFLSGGFVKIDVEGYELSVLRGAKVFLSKNNPVLLIEIDPDMSLRAGERVQDTVAFLADLGYEMGCFKGGAWYPQVFEIVSGGQLYWFRKRFAQ